MLISVIYVSRRVSNRILVKEEIDKIVADRIDRNARLGIRGALIITNYHIAQIMEGPEAVIDQLMADALSNPVHEQVTIIERKVIDGYGFTDWCLAYRGSATYMDQKVAAVLEKQNALSNAGETHELYNLMRLLALESHKQQGPIGDTPLN